MARPRAGEEAAAATIAAKELNEAREAAVAQEACVGGCTVAAMAAASEIARAQAKATTARRHGATHAAAEDTAASAISESVAAMKAAAKELANARETEVAAMPRFSGCAVAEAATKPDTACVEFKHTYARCSGGGEVTQHHVQQQKLR